MAASLATSSKGGVDGIGKHVNRVLCGALDRYSTSRLSVRLSLSGSVET